MDPDLCFTDLLRAILAGDSDTASELAGALASWVAKGGYVPTGLRHVAPQLGIDLSGTRVPHVMEIIATRHAVHGHE